MFMKKDSNQILKSMLKTKKDCLSFRHGFTLLELIVIIAIISIMTSVILIYGKDNNAEKKLEIAANLVESTVRLAHSNALTGKDASGGCSYGFFHSVLPPATSYGITGCQTITHDLEGGAYFFNDGVPNNINFGIPHGNVTSANTDLRIVLRTTEAAGISRVICINSRGATKILDNETLNCDFLTW